MTTTAATTARRSRRVLAPLATLAAAGALVVGSGATFTSASENPSSVVTAGSFDQVNSRDGSAIFDVTNIKPGDTVKGSVTITNDSSMPGLYKVTEVASNGFTGNLLTMEIVETGPAGARTVLTKSAFGALPDVTELGTFAAGETRTYAYTVHLDISAGNDEQGATASATYTWDGVQVDNGTTVDQSGDALDVSRNANG